MATMGKPLNGEEVRNAIVKDIDRMLSLDDRFHKHNAYDGFTYTVKLTVNFPSAPIALQKAERELSGAGGEPLTDTEQVLLETSRALEPPDHVRMETDQPIPTLVQEKGELVEKNISYTGKDTKGRPAVPRQQDTKRPLTVKGA